MDPEGNRPDLRIEADACRPTGTPGGWTASWRVQNRGAQPLELLAAWLPHDRFFGARRVFEPPMELLASERAGLELPVVCPEPLGSVVENAFVILELRCQQRLWRAFARHLITRDEAGGLQHLCQAITFQPVGFSAQSGLGANQRE